MKGKSWDALWNGDDRKESGGKYGDEVCNILASELEMTEVRVLVEHIRYMCIVIYPKGAK